jgi:hypothetical protein
MEEDVIDDPRLSTVEARNHCIASRTSVMACDVYSIARSGGIPWHERSPFAAQQWPPVIPILPEHHTNWGCPPVATGSTMHTRTTGVNNQQRGPSMVSASAKEFPPGRLDTVNECLWLNRGDKDDERIRLRSEHSWGPQAMNLASAPAHESKPSRDAPSCSLSMTILRCAIGSS